MLQRNDGQELQTNEPLLPLLTPMLLSPALTRYAIPKAPIPLKRLIPTKRNGKESKPCNSSTTTWTAMFHHHAYPFPPSTIHLQCLPLCNRLGASGQMTYSRTL
ncbi:hypothetical protein J3R82DRAFT_3689 [Butyriboletus roseoflavus]|nr:hypothetical protein J3R82DRAFT_3689 [Butyriboletus roseoflavus]